MTLDQNIILFDGVCNLCNYWVDFFIRKDSKQQLFFSSLQSDFGQGVLTENNLPHKEFNSFILLSNGRLYQKSTAAIKALSIIFPIMKVFLLVPKPIRDIIYSLIAKNRYRLFGKKETCRIPTLAEKDRFIA